MGLPLHFIGKKGQSTVTAGPDLLNILYEEGLTSLFSDGVFSSSNENWPDLGGNLDCLSRDGFCHRALRMSHCRRVTSAR
jgi:hypothetical protein